MAGDGVTNQPPPGGAPPAAPSAPTAPDPGDYGSQAAALGQQFQQNEPTQQANPRTVYRFGVPEVLPGPGDFSEFDSHVPPPPPPGYDFQNAEPAKQANWDKLTDAERWVQSALPGVSGTFADIYKKWDASWPGHSIDMTIQPALDSVIGKSAASTAQNYAGVGALVGAAGGLPGMALGAAGTAVTGAVAGAVGQAVGGDKGVAFVNALPNYLNAAFQAAHSLLFRTLGVGQQAIEAYQSGTVPEFERDFKAAWYAGDLEADLGGNPLTLSANPLQNVSAANWAAAGQFAGMLIPIPGGGSLAGVVGGAAGEAASGLLQSLHMQSPDPLGGGAVLVQARQRIAELMGQGMTAHDALIQTRSEWYTKLGALSFRAQTNNLVTSLLANPLFPVMEGLRPLERVTAIQKIVAGMDAAPESIAELGNTATAAEDALKVAQDAHGASPTDSSAQAVAAAQATLEQAQNALSAAQKTALSWGQQKLVQVFGLGSEDAGRANLIKLGGGLDTKNPLSGKWNPLALTPEARATEMMTIYEDNLTSYHAAANTDAATGKFDLLGAERTVTRAANGINDPRMGNAMLSYEGRSLNTMVKESANIIGDMAAVHRATEFEQTLLGHIAEVLGVTPENVMSRLAEGDPGQVALLNQYMSKAGQTPGALEGLQQVLESHNLGALEQGTLARVYHVLKDVPYTDQQELATWVDKAIEANARQVALQFGTKQSGMIRRIAEMTKAAENLAHFRVNPAYPIRMWITDTVNMLRDGTFGTLSNGEIDNFWKELKFEPGRLYQGTGYTGPEDFAGADSAAKGAGPMVQAENQTHRAIYGITNAKKDWIQKVTSMLGSVKPPDALNAQSWARDITRLASKRALTNGYISGMGQFMAGAVGKTADYSGELAQILGPQRSRLVENALASVRKESQLDAMLAHPNLNLTTANVAAQAEADYGLKLDRILGPEVQAKIDPIINEAAKTGDKAAVEAAFKKVDTVMQAHLDALNDQNLPAMRDEAFAKTMAEKSGAGPKLWAETNDQIISAQIKHTMDQAYLQETLGRLGGKEANGAWAAMRANDENFFNRAWTRAEAQMQGFADAAKAANLPGGDEMMTQFQNWRGDAQKYISDRNSLWNDFWAAKAKGETPPVPYAQIVVKNDNGYRALVERERAYQQSLDAGISKMLPPEEQPAYLAWRNRVATLRTADKEAVLDFRLAIRGLRGQQLEDAYTQFNQERLGRLGQLQFENSAGQAAMQGEPHAVDRYTQSTAKAKSDLDTLDALMRVRLSETQLKPEDLAALDKLILGYATPAEADTLKGLAAAEQAEQQTPPLKPRDLTPEEEARWQARAMQEAQGSLKGVAEEQAKAIAEAKNEAVGGTLANNMNSAKVKKFFRITDGNVQAPAVWRNTLTGEWKPWSVKPPGSDWAKEFGQNVDGWIEQAYEALGGNKADGLSPQEMWQTMEAAAKQFKGLGKPSISAGGVPIDSLSPDLLKENPGLLEQLWPKPKLSEPDTEAIADNQYARNKQKLSVEFDVWKRVSPQSDMHAAANATAQETTEGLAGGAATEAPPVEGAPPQAIHTTTPSGVSTNAQGAPLNPDGTPIDWRKAAGPAPIEQPAPTGEAPQAPTEPLTLTATHPDTVHQDAASIPDMGQVVKQSLFQNQALDEHMYTRGQRAVDAMKASTLKLMDQAPLSFGDIPAEAQAGVRGMIEKAYGDLADARYASIRYGEYTRDSALLNYSRRYNFDTWLSNVFPYEFWTTHSAFNWFLHSVDRPAMMAAYLRMKQFMGTAGAPEQGFPTRLAGTLKVNLPFMPDFMGHSVYVDPLKLGLPFEGWQSPFEKYAAQEQSDMGAASRQLQTLVNDGKITAADQAEALKSHAGPVWERAVAQAQLNDQQGSANYADLLTSMFPAHLPLMYAYDAATGKPNPTPIPIARSLDGLLQTLGVAPGMTPGGPVAAIRKSLGLHGFGAWDDYYAERQVTNELGLSKISVDDARQALLTHQGPVWEDAVHKAAVETSGGGPMGAVLGLSGVPVKGYPPGEQYLRSLKDDYQAAWKAYDNGDTQAVSKFNDAHPGYEERLSLFKTPEQRLHQFTQDQFWNTWHDLPTLTRDELKNQLSPDFAKMVQTGAPGEAVSPETKAFRRNVSTEQMAVWLKLMGSTPVGTLGTEAKPLSDAGGQAGPNLDLAPPELAQRAQVFYDTRRGSFANYYAEQKGYYDIPAGQRVDQGPRDSATAQAYLQARDAQFGSDIEAKIAQYDAFGGSSKARTAFARANGIFDYFNFRKQFAADHPGFKNAIGFNDTVKENTPTARSLYAKEHPQLTTYWAWRDDFLKRNPDLAPYLSDQTKGGTVQAPPRPPEQKAPNYSPQEWQQTLGWNLWNLVQDTAHDSHTYPLSPVARQQLEKKAAQLGYGGSVDEFARVVAGAHP